VGGTGHLAPGYLRSEIDGLSFRPKPTEADGFTSTPQMFGRLARGDIHFQYLVGALG
jgi:hypothetical protein